MYRVSPFVSRFALALLAGATLATIWVNLAPATYYDSIEWLLFDVALPGWLARLPFSLTPLMLVSDVLMAFFLFFLAKELWEALILEHGALRRQRALLPLALVFGGMAGAVLVWTITASLIETAEEAGFATGWPVPLGSDVVLGYLVGRRIFGPGHPALHFLLVLTIIADIAALVVMGVSHLDISLRLLWLILPVAASLAVWALFGRRPPDHASEQRKRATLLLWPYMLAGLMCWFGVAASGLPPALGLLPVVPAIAHANRTFGLFAEAEGLLHDPLNRLAQLMAWPLVGVLFLFGLTCGGVDLLAFAPTTATTLAALWLGRPLGMLVIGLGLAALAGLPLPPGISLRDILRITLIMSMGFTVPVLGLDSTLPGGAMQEAARLGLAISLISGLAALLVWCRKDALVAHTTA